MNKKFTPAEKSTFQMSKSPLIFHRKRIIIDDHLHGSIRFSFRGKITGWRTINRRYRLYILPRWRIIIDSKEKSTHEHTHTHKRVAAAATLTANDVHFVTTKGCRTIAIGSASEHKCFASLRTATIQ